MDILILFLTNGSRERHGDTKKDFTFDCLYLGLCLCLYLYMSLLDSDIHCYPVALGSPSSNFFYPNHGRL